MYSEDAYCLGLLYAHIYANKKMVLKDDLEKFHKIIEFNLRSMNKDTNDTYAAWYDNDPSIYFVSEGKNGEIYYVLYPDFDLDRAKSKYMGCLSTDVLVASQKENALSSIDLKKENGRIVKKKINELRTPTYDFLKDVEVCGIKRNEDHIQLQETANRRIEKGRRWKANVWHYVKKNITESTKLSITNVDDEATKDCRSCQNMSCRVESYEKPVDNCIGYMHRDEEQEQPKRMRLTKKESRYLNENN